MLFFLAAGLLLVTVVIARQLMLSRYSELLMACRDAEERLWFLGHDPANVKTVAFVIAAGMASIAGALFVPIVGIISPNDVGVVPSIALLIGVAIGGHGTLLGPVQGAIAVAWAGTTLSPMASLAIKSQLPGNRARPLASSTTSASNAASASISSVRSSPRANRHGGTPRI
ncbi:MAG: hypothetical protein JO100_16970 [Pseudonocardia sp.]|nr:hypothetical protein [Pseudonocardia sp.]